LQGQKEELKNLSEVKTDYSQVSSLFSY